MICVYICREKKINLIVFFLSGTHTFINTKKKFDIFTKNKLNKKNITIIRES